MKPTNTPDPATLESMIRSVAAQLGTDTQTVRSSMENGSAAALLQKLKPEDAATLQKVLSDKETTARILASPQAQELIRKLTERK